MVERRIIHIAPDKFKDSLSSPEVCDVLREGIRTTLSADWTIRTTPMADGGEGTVTALVDSMGGRTLSESVTGPRGSTVKAEWGWIPGGDDYPPTGIIEMASASGLALLTKRQRDPMVTTTRGTGELIKKAVDRGAEQIILGIGGSATVDGGLGMAKELGFQITNSQGESVGQGGSALLSAAEIETENVPEAIVHCEIKVACDVTNPLLGPDGAARVYGPQKGAEDKEVETLERSLAHWADVVEREKGKTFRNESGAGAAGGLGFGLVALLDAELKPGAELIMNVMNLNSYLDEAEVLITGEGSLDRQTSYGKTPSAVARRASEADVDFIIGIGGALGDGFRECYDVFDWMMSLVTEPVNLEYAIDNAQSELRNRSRDIARLITLVQDPK